jgi:hypothetical protein
VGVEFRIVLRLLLKIYAFVFNHSTKESKDFSCKRRRILLSLLDRHPPCAYIVGFCSLEHVNFAKVAMLGKDSLANPCREMLAGVRC